MKSKQKYNVPHTSGGLAVAGLHMMGQLRRATGDVASSVYDQFSDNAVPAFDDVLRDSGSGAEGARRRHQYVTHNLD